MRCSGSSQILTLDLDLRSSPEFVGYLGINLAVSDADSVKRLELQVVAKVTARDGDADQAEPALVPLPIPMPTE